jgi:titin
LAAALGCDTTALVRPASATFARGVTSAGVPTAPSAADAIPMLSDRVDVFWTDNSINEDGFRVERSVDGGATWAIAATRPVGAVALVDEGRAPETRVCYRVIAFARKGDSAPSNVDCTTPPATPTGVTAVFSDFHSVQLSWKDNSSVEDGYYITRWPTDSMSAETLIAEPPANATSYNDATVNRGTSYSYRIRARKEGGFGTASERAVALAPPPSPLGAPSNTDAAPTSSTTVRVSWADNATIETGFRIQSASGPAGPWITSATRPANTTSLDVAARPEERVCFRVVAFNLTTESNASAPDCTSPPARPTSLTVGTDGTRAMVLRWMDNSAVEDGYEVSRISPISGWAAIITLPPGTSSYRDTTIDANISYTYRVRAAKDGGGSDYSAEAAVVTPAAVPSPPSAAHAELWIDQEGYGWVYLAIGWTDASANEDGFRVEQSADGVSGWTLVGTTVADTTHLGARYDLFASPPTSGCYRVLAFNARGASPPSNVTCTETGVGADDLVATPVDQHRIDLSWTDHAAFESGYAVLRATAMDGIYAVIAELPANATSYSDVGLLAGQEYWYLVLSMHDGYTDSDWTNYSNYATATSLAGTASAGPARASAARIAEPIRVTGPIRTRGARLRPRR